MPKTRGCCFNIEFSMHLDPVQRQHHTWALWGWAGAEGKGTDENKFAGNKETPVKQKRKCCREEQGVWKAAVGEDPAVAMYS